MNTKKLPAIIATALLITLLSAYATADDGSYSGRISLVGKLDEPDGLCIDIPGPPSRLFLDRPAWVHTCKPGDIRDMIFHFDSRSSSPIKSTLVEPAICIEADEFTAGSLLHFIECDDESEQQLFRYTPNGQIRVEATAGQDTELCLAARTAKTVPMGNPPEPSDPNGHAMIVNLERSHVARPMVLRECSSAPLEVSQWEAYEERPPRPFASEGAVYDR